ncbi:MAG: polysaccharide deacetylase family protein [Candidatus Omnitrophica bacterium]|nr:polysaccharide deacetylase family protein [Candidatus Omnitrophota bacterium]MDD5654509.1 polysaccharide deacetylase family protein [Candidatus Omnitrophota bacterium]
MKNKIKKILITFIIAVAVISLGVALFTVFYDQAVLVRRGTVYHPKVTEKVVALTFDDGPSPVWTPQILDELKRAEIKATFFMLGKHVAQYPDIAKRAAQEGHEIENHSYTHHGLINYKMDQLEKEINDTEAVIKETTGRTTKYFRPPKAWATNREKQKIKEMGYETVLWSLNSKDWVTFHDKQIRGYILRHIRPGDIILFHDSGAVFSTEGGDRRQTVKTIFRLAEQLKEKGYKFVTVAELLDKYAK